jgi:hypothetical protein
MDEVRERQCAYDTMSLNVVRKKAKRVLRVMQNLGDVDPVDIDIDEIDVDDAEDNTSERSARTTDSEALSGPVPQNRKRLRDNKEGTEADEDCNLQLVRRELSGCLRARVFALEHLNRLCNVCDHVPYHIQPSTPMGDVVSFLCNNGDVCRHVFGRSSRPAHHRLPTNAQLQPVTYVIRNCGFLYYSCRICVSRSTLNYLSGRF